jgi:hypothetical protein
MPVRYPVAPSAFMRDRLFGIGVRSVFGLLIFAVLATAIMTRAPKFLSDFDQSFYLTIAYDLDRHGVFSNGMFDEVNSPKAAPPPGMFFGPLYPWLIYGAGKIDARFARAVSCSVEANHKVRDSAECEVYARPMHLLHAALLALGVLAIALAAETIVASTAAFWLTGILAAIALLPDTDLFSFVMTESVTFALYSLTTLAMVMGWATSRRRYFALAGVALGLLCLARPSFQVLALVLPALILLGAHCVAEPRTRSARSGVLAFGLAFLLVIGPWLARNAVAVGKWGLSEEYGSAALIERFAFDDMTAREFVLAFPYCLPEIGEPVVNRAFGPQAMERFVYYTPRSFFHVGRLHRDKLVEAHGRLDPLIGDLIRDEMRERWWRYLLVSVPLAWCGMWVGGLLGLALVPLFAWACVATVRRSQPLLLLYATPALVMLGLHAAVANQYTRYNLILIGPFCAGAAWAITRMAASVTGRRRDQPA